MIFIDLPRWPGRGRLWSHLVSDVSYAELHVFAEALGVSRRAFDRDHYDVAAQRFPVAVWLGATVVPSREIVRLLISSGLRRRRHRRPQRSTAAVDPPPAVDPPTAAVDPPPAARS